MRHRLIAKIIALVSLVGCGTPPGGVSHSLVDDAVDPRDAWGEREHDMGVVVARSQTLTHAYTLRNPTGRVVRLISAQAMTPCCSSVVELPTSVGPGELLPVEVRVKLGGESGPKRFEFAVVTADPDVGPIYLGLEATLVAGFEASLSNDDVPLSIGQEGRRVITIITRRQGSETADLVEAVAVAPPLSASLAGRLESTQVGADVVETRQTVVVSIPSSRDPGRGWNEVTLRRRGGSEHVLTLTWDVHAGVRVSPSSLVIGADEATERQVVVASTIGPIRVTSIAGELLASTSTPMPSSPAAEHTVHLKLDGSRRPGTTSSEIEIETDLMAQPKLKVTILILPRANGDQP